MSHGGGESGKVHEKSHPAKRKSVGSGDEFAQAIAKISVAQICESAGFQTFQQSALETLSDVTVRYICNIGKCAQFYASLAGRTEGNAFDIIQGLEDLGSAQGFTGASDVGHCIASSGTVREIVQYVGDAEDIPFAYSIPTFPVVRERKPAPSFLQIAEEPPGEHIPAWLPAFPDPQTYIELPTRNEGAADANVNKIEAARQHRKMDRSLLNFQQQFTCNVSEGPSSFNLGDGTEAKHTAAINPFLTAPLHSGEKEVSFVVPPAKLSNEAAVRYPAEQNCAVDNHVTVLETFAPAIEAMKSRLCDSEERHKKALCNQRPAVKFKVGVGKKSLGAALDLSPQCKVVEKIGLWFGKDNENNDKKRRAEEILKQSMENPGELAQL